MRAEAMSQYDRIETFYMHTAGKRRDVEVNVHVEFGSTSGAADRNIFISYTA